MTLAMAMLNWVLEWFGVFIVWPDIRRRPIVHRRVTVVIVCGFYVLVVGLVDLLNGDLLWYVGVLMAWGAVSLFIERSEFRRKRKQAVRGLIWKLETQQSGSDQ